MTAWPLLSTPFFTGTGVAASSAPSEAGGELRPVPFAVVLDGHPFVIDLANSEVGAQDTFRDSVVQNAEPNDSLFNARGAWGRYQFSWHHGAGQELADLDPDADSARFSSSRGICWDEKYQAELIHSTSRTRTLTTATPVMIRSADYVFVGDGTTLYRTSDLASWTAMTAPGGTITGLATDGTDLYVATTTGVVKYVGAGTTPTAFTTAVTGSWDTIAVCANRLLASQGSVLKEIAAAGTLTTVKTHFSTSFRWTTLFNIGSRIYIGGYSGSRSELYTVTTDSFGALVPGQEAAPLPVGELLRTGAAYASVAMLCTSAGIRFAEISGDGTLTYGPLITEPGDVRCAVGDGADAYFGWSTIAAGISGVGRASLDIDVQPLQPAYGTDVYETTIAGTVAAVARLGGLTAFAVASDGVWVESATAYVGDGTIDSGRIAFGTVEPKALVGITATFFPLLAGESIEMKVLDEFGVVIGAGIQSQSDATTLDIDLGGEPVPFCSVVMNLIGAGSTTPRLLRWRLRAYPIPPAVQQFVLALGVRESSVLNSERGAGQQFSYDVSTMHAWIEDLWRNRRYTVLRLGTREHRVRVDNFKWNFTEWTEQGDVPSGRLIVQLIEA